MVAALTALLETRKPAKCGLSLQLTAYTSRLEAMTDTHRANHLRIG